jgi:hypothetical protein
MPAEYVSTREKRIVAFLFSMRIMASFYTAGHLSDTVLFGSLGGSSMHKETIAAALCADCAVTGSFEELVELALNEVAKFRGDIEIVCGPITSGGRGSVEENLKLFNAVIKGLIDEGRPIFNQMPYEDALFRLRAKSEKAEGRMPGDASYNPIVLERFYRPLFETNRFTRAWFIKGWESSKGACWEHELLSGLGAQISYLHPQRITDFELRA